MSIYTEVHDFRITKVPQKQQIAIVQIQPRVQDPGYEKHITGLIAQALWESQCDWLILPKGAGSENLDRTIAKLVTQVDRDIVLICGSYIHQDQDRCTILLKRGKQLKCFFQYQILKNSALSQRQHIFVNTGFGDFAIIICDDMLEESELLYFNRLVDVLVLIARNGQNASLDKKLKNYCTQAYLMVCYANQAVISEYDEDELKIQGGESGFYLPYAQEAEQKQKELPTGKQDICVFPFHADLFEQGRRRETVNYPTGEDPKFIVPPYPIPQRYEEPERGKTYWESILSESHATPPSGLILEHWHASLKEQGKWKFQEHIQDYTVNAESTILGRSKKSSIVIENGKVSGKHIEIFLQNQSYFLRDLDSTGGTFLLEKKRVRLLDKRMEIKPGDLFWLAKKHCLCIKYNPQNPDQPALLELWENENCLFSVPIKSYPFVIGTSNPELIFAEGEGVSSEHTKIIFEDGKFFLEDMQSETGTYMWTNPPYVKLKTKLTPNEPLPLSDGLLFCLALEVFFRVRQEATPKLEYGYSLEE